MTGPETVRLVLRLPAEDAGSIRYLAERREGLGRMPTSAAVRARAAELLSAWADGELAEWWRVEVEQQRVEDARTAGAERLERRLLRGPLRAVLWHAYELRRMDRWLRRLGAGAGALAPVAADVAGELAEVAVELETAARAVGAEPARLPAK